MDVDLIKWKTVGDHVIPCAITEITRTDEPWVTEAYLDAILYRYMVRDKQGRVLKTLSKLLEIPGFIVLFNQNLDWLYVYSIEHQSWKLFYQDAWSDYLSKI